jgi:pimeloyl-ACP methyl ester carboxylesterase
MYAETITLPAGTVEMAWWGPGPEAAPTLVMLHEGLGCVALWRDVPERLAAATGWGVFAYSRFGYGRSGPTALPRPMNYMQQEALTVLPQVLAAAGIRRAAILGHSDGGSIAAVYAGAAGSSTRSVSWPGSGVPTPSWPGVGTLRPVSCPGVAGAAPNTGHDAGDGAPDTGYSIGGASPTPGLNRAGVTLLGLITIAAHFFVEDLNITSIRHIKQDYDTGDLRSRLARYHNDVDMAFRGWNDAWLDPRFRDFDITRFLPGISVPILAIQGEDDPYGSNAQLHVMRDHVDAPIDIELIAHARHAPHLEARDATLSVITRFIATLGNPSP